ncbi:hypothetical protein, conserved [Trypanosoma brucei gambiense DAL972]|uniref:Uncharacterized protein n=2 Tax=Trypanosoma brucei TaxID=5691 RepID=C9ZLE7_TRYB9|nr:hypothetical protein, conserved [Trypanosoma brucei gambiense DAL972]RHW73377.1 hypothetical protein DPX39_030045000 [Trypanosoma brucei equiperdum]CBH10156.1 hypothetical protein, conserved [Trypanosoma brucei gambiense DAL972]|eukprot:XP_011772446.1 hypothetical protein, conserved [Trypanosoma brucei gambiense DAL972]
MCRVVDAMARIWTPHSCTSVQQRHAAPHALTTDNIHIRRLSSLRPHQQHHLWRLCQLVTGVTESLSGKETFVACSVVGGRSQTRCSPSLGLNSGNELCATGVNYALHRSFNAGKTLKGILRGCAEQNALGVAAASGHCYTSINDVYLCAVTCSTPSEGDVSAACDHVCSGEVHKGSGEVSDADASCSGVAFPCAECWRNLSSVAVMRREEGVVGPLNLFVYAQSEASALRSASIAQKNLTARPAPPIDVTVVISG